MKCPIDNVDLVMSERQGIEIDYCPKCRGVWLDRGELDKIIERSAAEAPPPVREERGRAEHARYEQPRDDRGHGHHDYRRKKRKSLLDDLFDF